MLQRRDLLDPETYERLRPRLRPELLALKALRRVRVGPLTLLFETRQTVKYYLQEILRAEELTCPDAVERKIAEVRPLVPAGTRVTATVMVGGGSEAEIRAFLSGLYAPLPCALTLRCGEQIRLPHILGTPCPSSATQYVGFQLAGLPLNDAPLRLRVRCDKWRHEATLSSALHRAISAQAAGVPASALTLMRRANRRSSAPAAFAGTRSHRC